MQKLSQHLLQPVDAASLAVFRIALGLFVPLELLHYYFVRPFIAEFYIKPEFHFKYPFFEWVPDLFGTSMTIFLVFLCLSFVMMGLGLFYRITKWTSFLGFCFLFLMERASFLNHWYMICLFGFLMLFIPANGLWSLDSLRKPEIRKDWLPRWHLYLPLTLISIVYLYSGIVKINGDWLAGKQMVVYLENAFGEASLTWALLASYWTILFELLMVPLLLWRKTRTLAFVVTMFFHLTNSQLFTVGLFPFMMIAFTTIYFQPNWPRKVLKRLFSNRDWNPKTEKPDTTAKVPQQKWIFSILIIFFSFQILFPFRSVIYKGNQLWTEEGLICSWKMMLEAKTNASHDAIVYRVYRSDFEEPLRIDPKEHGLSWAQENKLVRNPDLILQFAHQLGKEYMGPDGLIPEIYVDAYLGLNGRPVQRFIHPNVDLNAEPRRWIRPYPWVMPLLETLEISSKR